MPIPQKLKKELESLSSNGLLEIEVMIKSLKTKKAVEPPHGAPYSVFDEISDLAADVGISDLARNHDHYLYGTDKR